MNILCYNIEENLMEAIAMKFLPRGFHFFPANSDFELKKILYTKGVQLIIADIGGKKSKEEINMGFLTWLKSVDQNNDFKKIVLSKISDEYNIRRLMELGITSFISKNSPTQDILNRVEAFLVKLNDGKPDSRKHVRITPDESDNPSAMFYIGENKITSRIINVSMGGILLQAEGVENVNQIRKDAKIPRLQIMLNNKKIITNTIVVAKKDNFLGLQYSLMSDTYKEALARYIFKKISNT